MSTIKDRNGMSLTEAEDIKERWQEELYKNDLHEWTWRILCKWNNPDTESQMLYNAT